MSGKSSPGFQWTDDGPVIQLSSYTDCLLKIIALINIIATHILPRPILIYFLVFLHSSVLFYKKLSFLYQAILNFH